MRSGILLKYFLAVLFTGINIFLAAQTVPAGIHYQAVARDNYGKELADRDIDVRFSVLKGNSLGQVEYQELHSKVRTSKYGVFSLIIGKGEPTGGTVSDLSKVDWGGTSHFLKVEVKFSLDFVDMGTIQFLAVPYALYALKSLEPGPQGPQGPQGIQGLKGDGGPQGLQGVQGIKGDTGPQGLQGVQGLKGDAGPQGQLGIQGPKGDTGVQGLQGIQGPKGDQGDPASDKQTLSFDGSNLSITGGNLVSLAALNVPHNLSILGDTLSIYGGNKVGLPNEIQDLTLDINNILKITKNSSASSIDLSKYLDDTDKQTLGFDTGTNKLSISNGNNVDLTPMKQDLSLLGNTLTITNKTSPAAIDLAKYLQTLGFNPSTNILTISDGNTVDLTSLKNDADSDPTNEIQDIQLTGNLLTITKNSSSTGVDLSKYLDNTDQILSYNASTYTLSLTNGGNVSLGSIIAFRAKKTTSEPGLAFMTDYDFKAGDFTEGYNDGGNYNGTTGVFTATTGGLYNFSVGFTATGSGGSRAIKLYLNGSLYEILNTDINSGSSFDHSVSMKIAIGDKVKVVVNTGTSTESGTGSFSGFRVY